MKDPEIKANSTINSAYLLSSHRYSRHTFSINTGRESVYALRGLRHSWKSEEQEYHCPWTSRHLNVSERQRHSELPSQHVRDDSAGLGQKPGARNTIQVSTRVSRTFLLFPKIYTGRKLESRATTRNETQVLWHGKHPDLQAKCLLLIHIFHSTQWYIYCLSI